MATPLFRFYSGSLIVAEIALSQSFASVESHVLDKPLGELQDCAFELDMPEPGQRYRLQIGDFLADAAHDEPPNGHPGEGRTFPRSVQWQSHAYFESARGDTMVTLSSRPAGSELSWRARAEMSLRIVPTKLGEERYEAMYQALSRLSLSFVHDLISKSAAGLGLKPGEVRARAQAPQVRLRLIEALWTSLAPALSRIQNSPVTALQRTYGRTRLWGSENVRSRALAGLAERGFTARSTDLPLKTKAALLSESSDTYEHRVIKGFLRLLLAHLAECADDARSNVTALRADAAMLRDFPDALLATEQRVARLETSIEIAERRQAQIRAVWSSKIFSPIRSASHRHRTPVFENILSYRRVWNLMQRYSARAAVIVGSDVHQRVKATWKMYEQWVFFQFSAAIRKLGFRCEEGIGLLQQKSRYRFTLDLDFGSRLSFVGPDGNVVTVTYQPLIYGHVDAVARRDSLFRGQNIVAPWSPDILIEVLDSAREPGKPPRVKNAIILDAKYTRRISTHHWDVAKYSEIRSTASRAAVVKQVWIVFPGEQPEIVPKDEFVRWSAEGPTVPVDETVFGSIALIPHTYDEPVAGDPVADEPSPIVLDFLRGMLSRFGVELDRQREIA